MATRETHIKIARRHKYFIDFTCQSVEHYPDKCSPDVFCVWFVVASYYRTIHLLEAIFDKYELGHAVPTNEEEADSRRNGLLRKLELPLIRKEIKILRRFALHAKYLPDDAVFDYDVITQLDKTRDRIVNGVLARIEKLTAEVLGVSIVDI